MATKKVQLNFRIKKELLDQIDKLVDGINYLSRGQIFQIALSEWLESQKKNKVN